MAIVITIEGDDTVITGALDAFVRQNGWTDSITTEDGEEIPNPTSKEQKAQEVISRFIGQTVTAYNIATAEKQARDAAAAQTRNGLSLTNLRLTLQ